MIDFHQLRTPAFIVYLLLKLSVFAFAIHAIYCIFTFVLALPPPQSVCNLAGKGKQWTVSILANFDRSLDSPNKVVSLGRRLLSTAQRNVKTKLTATQKKATHSVQFEIRPLLDCLQQQQLHSYLCFKIIYIFERKKRRYRLPENNLRLIEPEILIDWLNKTRKRTKIIKQTDAQ